MVRERVREMTDDSLRVLRARWGREKKREVSRPLMHRRIGLPRRFSYFFSVLVSRLPPPAPGLRFQERAAHFEGGRGPGVPVNPVRETLEGRASWPCCALGFGGGYD